jgi:glycosyltransferase involved in cell wall biosynthesis
MKISVITVCYNAAASIGDCLRSVAEQTHHDIEHLIIDGSSTDDTVAIVQGYPHVTRLVSERDAGIYDAMNKGLDLVSGDYILFLNADDRFASPTSLAKAAAAIAATPGADVYYGSLEVRSPTGPSHVFRPPPPADAPAFMVCGCLPHQSTLASPRAFDRTDRFDLRYRIHSDYDWFLKVLADPAITVRSIDEVIGSFLVGGASSQLARGQIEVYEIQNRSPLYATQEWDKKRIAIFQEAFLGERLRSSQLTDALSVERKKPTNVATEDCRTESETMELMMDNLRGGPRWNRERLRYWILNTCVRVLPSPAVDVLRRLRTLPRPSPQVRDVIRPLSGRDD